MDDAIINGRQLSLTPAVIVVSDIHRHAATEAEGHARAATRERVRR